MSTLSKITVLLIFSIFLGCGQKDSPPPITPEMAEADAEGAVGAAEEFEYLNGLGPYGTAFYVGAIVAISVEASAAAQSDKPIIITDTLKISLPENLEIQENKYEKIGEIHNLSLHKLLNQERIDLSLSNDRSKRISFIVEDVYNNLNLKDKYTESQNKKELESNMLNKASSEILPTLEEKRKSVDENNLNDSMTLFKNNVRANIRKLNFRNEESIFETLNKQIKEIINSNDSEKIKKTKLIYLSVYKHSYYFWSHNNK